MLEAARRSGVTLAQYARREGLEAKRLWNWRARLSKPSTARGREKTPQRSGTEGLYELVPMGQPSGSGLEVTLRGGRKITVPVKLDASVLRRLVEVLEAC